MTRFPMHPVCVQLVAVGFSPEWTGGNCSALTLPLPEGAAVWITDELEIPIPASTECIVGMHDDSGEERHITCQMDAGEILAAVARLRGITSGWETTL